MSVEISAEQSTTTQAIGQRLRVARERLNYSQQQVAQRLRLKCVVIAQIEQDLMESDLTAPFMRGYIRSYARLVQIAESELLPPLYASQQLKRMRPVKSHFLSLRTHARSHRKYLVHVTWGIIVFCAIVVGSWLWQHRSQRHEHLNSAAVVEKVSTEQSHTPPPPPPPLENIQISSGNEPTTEPITFPPTVGAETALSDRPKTPTLEAVQDDTSAATAWIEETAALVFNFSGECWLEVYDAQGQLFSGSRKQGEWLQLQGLPPYQLTIGAPDKIQMTYYGEPISLEPYTNHRRIARLTLPLHASASSQP